MHDYTEAVTCLNVANIYQCKRSGPLLYFGEVARQQDESYVHWQHEVLTFVTGFDHVHDNCVSNSELH